MELLNINLHKIVRERMGDKGKYVPGFMISAVERLVHQNELNEVLEATYPAEGADFARKVYDYFNIGLEVRGIENIPEKGRFVFASNHPLGGLDGIGLIAVLGEKYGDSGVRFLVNDLLMNIEPLRPVFLPVNKFGRQARGAAKAITEAYESDAQILIFPAGLCSRIQESGEIADLKWQKSFLQRAVATHRDIIPVKFEGLNRMRFYRTADLRKKLGMKFNVEQVLLPAELCAARNKTFRITFGRPISWQSLEKRLAAWEPIDSLVLDVRRASEAL